MCHTFSGWLLFENTVFYLHGKVNIISTVENPRTVDFNSREMAEYVFFTDLIQQNIQARKTTASKRVTSCVTWKGLENEGCGCVGVLYSSLAIPVTGHGGP
jgi:hypothetical protein